MWYIHYCTTNGSTSISPTLKMWMLGWQLYCHPGATVQLSPQPIHTFSLGGLLVWLSGLWRQIRGVKKRINKLVVCLMGNFALFDVWEIIITLKQIVGVIY
jgi:hypothetical protein